jgi:hypothetical protein
MADNEAGDAGAPRDRGAYLNQAYVKAFGTYDEPDWDPQQGFVANRDRLIKVYDYYRDGIAEGSRANGGLTEGERRNHGNRKIQRFGTTNYSQYSGHRDCNGSMIFFGRRTPEVGLVREPEAAILIA